MNKIYCFSNVANGGEGVAYAIGDDGVVLGSHFCSNEYYVPMDLGVLEGYRLDRHETYKKHFPNGYEMEFVSSVDFDTHKGLQEALKLNSLLEKEEK